jgi:hypothetical protein
LTTGLARLLVLAAENCHAPCSPATNGLLLVVMCKFGGSLHLTPNRRLAASDVVTRGAVPELVRRDMLL